MHLAVSPAVAGVTGQYFERCRPSRTGTLARDPANARRLWEISARLCGVPVDLGC